MLGTKLSHEGVVAHHHLISGQQASSSNQLVRTMITRFAKELDCTLPEYLHCVSRWGAKSPLIHQLTPLIQECLAPQIGELLNKSITLKKSNIIVKNKYAPHRVPVHQDISYQEQDLYDFSVWLALSDINHDDGALMCLPKSHLGAIYPAPDFWSPDYIDHMAKQDSWLSNAVSYELAAGDAVFFSSATWHASPPLQSNNFRIALVTRWAFDDTSFQPDIPPKECQSFGMWNCHQHTVNLFQKFVNSQNISPHSDFVKLCDQVINQLKNQTDAKSQSQRIDAIRHVQILHQAYRYHDGGDAFGHVYAKLWMCLLKYLETPNLAESSS